MDPKSATPGAQPGDATANPVVVEQDEEAPKGQTTEGGTGEADTATDSEGEPKGKPELTPEQKQIHGLQRRIGRLTSDKVNNQTEIQLLQRQLREIQDKAANAQTPEDDKSLTDEEIERRAEQKAAQRREAERIEEAANKFVTNGRKAFKGAFDDMVKVVAEEIGGMFDKHGRLTPTAVALMDAEEPHEVVKYLSENPEEAAELAALSFSRQVRRVARIELEIEKGKAKPPPKPSGAPKPVEQLKGSAAASVDEAKLSDKEWEARKLKERLAR